MRHTPASAFRFDRDFSVVRAAAPDAAALAARVEELEAELRARGIEAEMRVDAAREDGFAAGMERAMQDQQMAVLAALDALQAGLEASTDELEGFRRRTVAEAAELALAAGEQLAGHALERRPTAALEEVLDAALKESADIRIRLEVNPALAPILQSGLLARTKAAPRIELAENPALAPGDARLSWGAASIELDAGARAKRLRAKLGQALEAGALEAGALEAGTAEAGAGGAAAG